MGFFKLFSRTKPTQGCVLVAGSHIGQLSHALYSMAQQQGLVLYQANHVATASLMQTVNPPESASGLSSFELNLLDPAAVKQLFKRMRKAGLHLELALFVPDIASNNLTADVNARWQQSGLMAVQLAQFAIRHMLSRQQGSLIFLGTAPATITAAENLVEHDSVDQNLVKRNLAKHALDDLSEQPSVENRPVHDKALQGQLLENALQAGIRALSQSLAREFQRKGLHISYLALKQLSLLDAHPQTAEAIATLCWHVYRQQPDAWSQELTA